MSRTGVRLRMMAARWFGAATLERYIDPALADLQAEYEDALHGGRTWRSRWVWIRGHVAFFSVILCYGGGRAMRILQDLSGDERSALIRTGGSAVAIAVLGTFLGTASYVGGLIPRDHPDAVRLAILLMPSELPLCVAAGLMFGILWGCRRMAPSRRARTILLLAAAASSLTMFVMLAWVIPATNQAFRVTVVRYPPLQGRLLEGSVQKGVNELTLGELRRVIEPDSYAAARAARDDTYGFALQHDRRALAVRYHDRWAMACAPFVLSLFALAAIARRPRRGVMLALAGCAALAAYYAIRGTVLAFDAALPAFAVAWAPNAALLIVSVAVTRVSPLRAA